MTNPTATELANELLHSLRAQPYEHLARRVEQVPVSTTVVRGGIAFQVEVSYLWDGKPGGDIRVIVAVDDGSLQAIMPTTADFIKAPDGQFVGE